MYRQPPIVTVIIPTYNSHRTLKLSLGTVLQQNFDDFEVWVVGDGCTDDTEEVVGSFEDGRIHWVNLPVNSGSPSAPRNEGLRRSRGKFIAYLGHDDLWFPWHLSGLIHALSEGKADFAYSLGSFMAPGGQVRAFTLPEKAWDTRLALSPSNWFHSRELTENIGLWEENRTIAADRDFLERVRKSGIKTVFFDSLSVLKYPSAWWELYSSHSVLPQFGDVEAMRENAGDLQLRLLVEIARRASFQDYRIYQRQKPVRMTVGIIIRFLLRIYGYDRWPVNGLMYRLWRRKAGLEKRKPNEFERR
ncbi:MAG: glycosyltransferase family 2 protein [Deltaproteobacteria bacterium]|nr:glycosyltransferase family 2 protein [Deltaproteobacteria bacterium]